MVLAQKQIYGSLKVKREPRNKPTHPWLIIPQQRRQEYIREKKQSLQQVVLRKLESYMSKNVIRTASNTIYKKISSKWNKDLSVSH